MKATLTITLAVLMLVAAGFLNESVTNRTSAQAIPPGQGQVLAQGKLFNPSFSATCFCKVTANGTEVAKPTKGGYTQPVQAEACRNYCRGLWDGNPPQRVAWAKLAPNACGNVALSMDAALGTMSYQNVRGETQHGINGTHFVTTCSCPSGQVASGSINGQKYCLIPPVLATVAGVPDQVNGAYAWYSSNFYKTSGPLPCITACQ